MPDASTPAVRYLALAQVAELLGVGVDEIVELIMHSRLRGARLGAPAVWRVEEASIAEYLAEQAEDARRRALWRQANAASFPELWGPPVRLGE
ncbi:helix-turn-helix domain-containing protein [Microbacterium sp. MYb64]|uniref:helix-turn-helix domain-containing protein n=1 Tax=Microbacterium sp. MYb64 TaxID=1848691 RepID=UPI000CFD63F6|nr:helix-turn-helix domain-containing protein [Microbacterium sp. MYb64]PRB08268.1 DNA-binding protein [Microbacterium sp. MYb64]